MKPYCHSKQDDKKKGIKIDREGEREESLQAEASIIHERQCVGVHIYIYIYIHANITRLLRNRCHPGSPVQ